MALEDLCLHLILQCHTKHESVEKKAFEKSATMAIEAITNIRTVAGLNCEDKFADSYTEELSGIST